jgi:hypothetical protein
VTSAAAVTTGMAPLSRWLSPPDPLSPGSRRACVCVHPANASKVSTESSDSRVTNVAGLNLLASQGHIVGILDIGVVSQSEHPLLTAASHASRPL